MPNDQSTHQYEGYATPDHPRKVTAVFVNGRELPYYEDVIKHCCDFEWGYLGAGPNQLAFSLLVHEYGMEPDRHPVRASALSEELLSRIPQGQPFRIKSEDIARAVECIRKSEKATPDHS